MTATPIKTRSRRRGFRDGIRTGGSEVNYSKINYKSDLKQQRDAEKQARARMACQSTGNPISFEREKRENRTRLVSVYGITVMKKESTGRDIHRVQINGKTAPRKMAAGGSIGARKGF